MDGWGGDGRVGSPDGWMVCCLVGRLVGWLVGWRDDGLAGWRVGGTAGWRGSRITGTMTGIQD